MILASIAMEELALSRIITAESEKVQHALCASACGRGTGDLCDILAVNQSVSQLMEVVLQNQMLLKSKMEKVLNALPCPGKPAHPCCPPCPAPDCECAEVAVFESANFRWCPCRCLPLKKVCRSNFILDAAEDTRLRLPGGKKLSFNLELFLDRHQTGDLLIELQMPERPCTPSRFFCTSVYSGGARILGSSFIETPRDGKTVEVCFRLISGEVLKINRAVLKIIAL